jgi:uncharacterized RDD family membrane protein YckC
MGTTLTRPQPAPTAAPPAAVPAPQPADRTQLDSRRVIARAIDGVFVGAPFLIPVLGLGLPLSIALVSISLAYFFVCEAVWGQTLGKRLIGLRVLMLDGRPATATAVASRTVLRLLDDGPFGLVVYLASGKRRGRVGDYAGGTLVARPTPGLPRARFSPLLIGYPALLAVVTAVLVLALTGPQERHDYLAAVDKTCTSNAKADAAAPARDLDALVARSAADHRALAAVKTPAGARKLRAEILALDGQVDRAVAAAAAHAKAGASREALRAQIRPIAAARSTAAKRYAELGLRSCAGLGAA